MSPELSVERGCVVCGQGSHRTDWIRTKKVSGVLFVACDSHSESEFNAAIQRASAPAPAKPVEKPQAAGGGVAQTAGSTSTPAQTQAQGQAKAAS